MSWQSITSIVLTFAAAAVWLAWIARAGLLAARIYQIEEYEYRRLLSWARQPAWLLPAPVLIATLVAIVVSLAGAVLHPLLPDHGWVAIGWLLGAATLHILWRPLPAKKALARTPRMRRLLIASGVIALLIAVDLASRVLALPAPLTAVIVAALACLTAPIVAIGVLLLGNLALTPVEARVRRGYVRRARQRFLGIKPQVIGVAGSYGKTSTKHILGALLAPHTPTLITPKSYNTLMGVTRTINENLTEETRAFVVEMDAYDVGEIAAMCRLVDPRLAIVTSVGPQHLERFGTVERIGDALYELVQALPPDGAALIHAGDEPSARLARRALEEGRRVVRYGIAGDGASELDVLASEVAMDGAGSHFMWRWPAQGLELPVRIPLLGLHNVLNVSVALAAVHLLGYPVEEAARAAAALEAVPHRLQVLPNTSGVTVIDDSYNANPVGVHNGLDVLARIEASRRILVTPGMVELGAVQDEENRRFGEHAARVCDHVILVGERQTAPLAAGLRAGGLPAERTHVVETLAEATATLARIGGAGAVVLFANDLPDTYLRM